MNPIFKINAFLLLILLVLSSCQEESEQLLLKKMIEFDQAFIPVLVYVRQDAMDDARKSVFFLNHTWKQFHEKYKNFQPIDNDDWRESFRRTDMWLSNSYAAIDASSSEDAFIFLDHVRYQLIELREQNQVDYFMDDIWEFEARLDLVEEVAVDQMLCLLDYCEFEDLVKDMNEAWREISITVSEVESLDFDKKERQDFQYRKTKLIKALADFDIAVEEADGEQLAVSATLLKASYLIYLSSFGDFESSKSYFASL